MNVAPDYGPKKKPGDQKMTQLETVKSGFFICIVGSIFIFAFIYFWNTMPKNNEQKVNTEIAECGFYPDELCSALFKGKEAATQIGNLCQKVFGEQEIAACIQTSCKCPMVQKRLHFITSPLSEEEGNFSLAYIITIHKEFDMFIRLLRTIYTPQNVYCIHIDNKSSKNYKKAVKTLVDCFENIFIASKSENVVYAGFSRLQADINCMKDLIHSKTQWNYVINLCGQDYPLKTNKELIHYIKSKWNGKNMTPGIVQPPHQRHRTQVRYKEYMDSEKAYVQQTAIEKSKAPHNLTIYFGSAYYILTRKFVEFILTDERAKDLLEWSRDTYSPDEHYWVTLNRLPDAPGATPNAGWAGGIRAIKWMGQEGKSHNGCKGHYIREICIYGLGDLKWLIESPNLFANKFEPKTYPLVMECLERRHRLKLLQQAEVPLESHWHLQEHAYFDMKLNN